MAKAKRKDSPPKVQASEVLAALAAKHASDVFVPECKMGPTWTAARGQNRRLDAWAMPKSWSPFRTIGYEIKVSRADFVGDKKWPAYLQTCHEFYFVAPSGLITPEELPPEVGLLQLTRTGSRLITKRVARRVTPDPGALADVLAYVLMSRSRVVPRHLVDSGELPAEGNTPEAREERMRRYLAASRRRERVGYVVGSRLARHVTDLHNEQQRAAFEHKQERERWDRVIERLGAMGCKVEAEDAWQVLSEVERLRGAVPRYLPGQIARLQRELESLNSTLAEIQGAG